MMSWSTYDIALYSPSGRFVAPVEAWSNLTMTRTVNTIGALTITLAWDSTFWNAATKDAILDVWRRVDGARSRPMGTVWMLMKRATGIATDGSRVMVWTFADCVDLLRRWCVMNDDGTPEATKTYYVPETVLKEVATEQMITRGSLPISIEPDGLRGESLTSVACGHQGLLSLFQQVCQSSTQRGTYLAFDFTTEDVLDWTFRAFEGQRGTDRSQTSPRPLVMSVEAGDLSEVTYEEDYTGSVSQIVCGGQQVSGAQVTATATDEVLDGLGPFAHTEAYTSTQNTALAYVMDLQANSDLRSMRPIVSLSNAVIPQTDSCVLGRTFDFGDRLTVRYAPISFDARLDSLTLSVDGSTGEEKIVGSFTGVIT
jgi:hypothetical protein